MQVVVQVGQLWAFIREIQKGDLVALPLKSKADIAIGRVEGDYEYKEVAPQLKHIRQVTWLRTIPKSEFDYDLLYSLGSVMTVCQIKRNNAENRIRRILDNTLEKQEEKISSVDMPFDKTYTGLSKDEIPNIIDEFKMWLGSEAGRKHLDTIEKEKQDVKSLMNKLNSMDKDSSEFVDEVLYGLLPNSKTKHAKRVSTFPCLF